MVRLSSRWPAPLAVVCAVLAGAAAAFAAPRLGLGIAFVALVLAAVVLAAGAATAALVRRIALAEDRRAERLAELDELLQVSTSEGESHGLLLRQVQRLAPAAGAVVLARIDSEQTFGARVASTPLRELEPGRPRADACLAVRLGRRHERGRRIDSEDPLVACELCGRLPGELVCEPLRTGGRTLGALLVTEHGRLGAGTRIGVRDAAQRTAPVLAAQRSVETTERRAAADPLTELPNRRAAEETLRRLSAHAGRSVSPIAAVLIDLDHFRALNDRFGETHGDEALRLVGRVLADGIRASDFVARYGGQTFLVVAPETDRQGGARLAENLRCQLERLVVPTVGRVTASFGVASLPMDAVEPKELLRRADRALTLAKSLGRNRVQEAAPTVAPDGD
jgi:diguanylate cyclase (GGDEF)-like protein